MKKSTLFAALLLVSTLMFGQSKLGLLIGAESIDDIASDDEKAAAKWFQKTYPNAAIVTPSNLSEIQNISTLWVIIDRIGIEPGVNNLPEAFRSDDAINALKAHVQKGGSLLLTNHATQLAVALDRLPYSPTIFGSGEGNQNDDIWGTHPVIGNKEGEIYDHTKHAIFKDMTYEPTINAGIYCFEGAGKKGDHNCMWDMNAISELSENPNKIADFEDKVNCTVLGTWNHVVDYCCAGIIDFEPTTTIKGRILAVGLAAYEWDLAGGVNTKQDQLEIFTENCLTYLNNAWEIATGIQQNALRPAGNDSFYTLNGLKVAQPKAGLYIKNNKKVVIK